MLLDRRTVLATGSALIASRAVGQGAAGVTSILRYLPQTELALIANKRSEFDCSAAIAQALADAPGAVYFPAGRYRVSRPVNAPLHFTGRFAPGPQIIGDGPGRTVFANGVRDAAMFDFDSGVNSTGDFRAMRDLRLTGFTIEGEGHGLNAIRLRTVYQSTIERVHIVGHRGDGIHIPCLYGDADGSNMVSLRQVTVESCDGWGIDTAASSGANENSFFALENVSVSNCGVQRTDPIPRSGGMRHKGQLMTLRQCGFAVNANIGLMLPGDAGLGNTIVLEATAFENNRGRHLLCTGYDGITARNIQLFSNDLYPAQRRPRLDAARPRRLALSPPVHVRL